MGQGVSCLRDYNGACVMICSSKDDFNNYTSSPYGKDRGISSHIQIDFYVFGDPLCGDATATR